MAEFYPLFSGSRGNSYFLGDKEEGILIDAGKNCKQLSLALENCGISPQAVKGILITHEHSDHVGALRVFAKKYSTPVYCSEGTKKELEYMGIADGNFPVHVLSGDDEISTMRVLSFSTSHDCEESIGFRISTRDNKILSFATDLGYLSENVKRFLLKSDMCVIESNHDEEMLINGVYHYSLKERILSRVGHLSNSQCAEFLPALKNSGVKNIMLSHLSGENNCPKTAYDCAVKSMEENSFVLGVDYNLFIASQDNYNGKAIEI